MFGLGVGELVLILGVCILMFGSKKIPQLAKGLGEAYREFQKSKNEIEADTDKEAKKVEPPKNS